MRVVVVRASVTANVAFSHFRYSLCTVIKNCSETPPDVVKDGGRSVKQWAHLRIKVDGRAAIVARTGKDRVTITFDDALSRVGDDEAINVDEEDSDNGVDNSGGAFKLVKGKCENQPLECFLQDVVDGRVKWFLHDDVVAADEEPTPSKPTHKRKKRGNKSEIDPAWRPSSKGDGGDSGELQGRNAWAPEGRAGYDSGDDDEDELKDDDNDNDKDPAHVLQPDDGDDDDAEVHEQQEKTPSGKRIGTHPFGSPVRNQFLIEQIRKYLSYLPRLYRSKTAASSETPVEFEQIVDPFNIPLPSSLIGRPDAGKGRYIRIVIVCWHTFFNEKTPAAFACPYCESSENVRLNGFVPGACTMISPEGARATQLPAL